MLMLMHSTLLNERLPLELSWLVQEGAKVFIRFNNLLPDNYESVKAIARRAVFTQKPTYADMLEKAAATTGSGGHWDKAVA